MQKQDTAIIIAFGLIRKEGSRKMEDGSYFSLLIKKTFINEIKSLESLYTAKSPGFMYPGLFIINY